MKVEKKEPIIFWAHFRSSDGESDKVERFLEEKESHLIFEYIKEQRKKLEEDKKIIFAITNCGVIK